MTGFQVTEQITDIAFSEKWLVYMPAYISGLGNLNTLST